MISVIGLFIINKQRLAIRPSGLLFSAFRISRLIKLNFLNLSAEQALKLNFLNAVTIRRSCDPYFEITIKHINFISL
jgi:hypothetical protein